MSKASQLKKLLESSDIMIVPGCWDAFSAKLIERAGFPAAFMSGFAVSSTRLAMPDTGLISFGEMVNQGQSICNAVNFPVFGDGDTGYGNAANVRRTVKEYARAGFSCIMIEDQKWPKRCGHTQGKQTVEREEAFARIQAAVDARNDGTDILIMARTDANGTEGFDEAIHRAQTFAEIGADITFLEAPKNEAEMRAYCQKVPGPKMANMVEQGITPVLPPSALEKIGYSIVAYPLTLLLAGLNAMEKTLQSLLNGKTPTELTSFEHLKGVIGFPEYYRMEEKYGKRK